MAITADDLTLLRSYVPWDPPDDTELSTRFDVLGSWQSVALEMTRRKRAELLANPASFSIGGEYGESWGENIRALGEQINTLEAMVPADEPGSGGFGVSRLERYGRGRC